MESGQMTTQRWPSLSSLAALTATDMALPELPPARTHSRDRTVRPRSDSDQQRAGESTEEPRARRTSSAVEGGLRDLAQTAQRKAEGSQLLLPHSSPSSRIIIRAKAKDSSSLLLYHWSTVWGGAGDRNKALFK